MRILLSYIHYPVCSGRYVKDALIRMGHDVNSCGYSTDNRIWGGVIDPKHNHYPDMPLDGAIPDWTPDLVIVMESAWKFHHPVYGDVPHVVYGMDNHVRDYRQAGIVHYFLAHKATSIMDMTAKDVTWLPCGFDPVAFTPSEIPFADRDYDVTLIGVLYPERVALLNALSDAGLKVQGGTGLLYEDYANAYHNSRIALNVSAKGDLNQRIFETAALGCVVLSEAVEDADNLKLDWIQAFKDDKGAIKQAKALIQRSEPILVRTELHTWDVRAQVIMDWYEATYNKGKASKKRGNKKEANA